MRFINLLVVIILLGILAACGGQAAPGAVEPTAEPATEPTAAP